MSQKQVALVTGASSGIGKAVAQRLMAEGLTVYVAARNVDEMADLADQGAIPLQMDITVPDEVSRAVAAITGAHGGVDILVNNAGFGLYGAVEDTKLDDARHQFEVNLFGLARLTQLLLPAMRDRRAGRIINISSMGGRIYTPLGAWYHASKHALEGWSDCLRLELASYGIDVVVVQPGLIQTGFGDEIAGQIIKRSGYGGYSTLAHAIAATIERSYAKGGGSPAGQVADVVARAVAAAKPRTRYVTGKYARRLIWARWILGDRAFDRLVMRQMGNS